MNTLKQNKQAKTSHVRQEVDALASPQKMGQNKFKKQQRLPKLKELTVNSSTNKAEQTSSEVTTEAQDTTLNVLTHHNKLKTKCPPYNTRSQKVAVNPYK